MHQQLTCPLFQLPAEVRQAIYAYYLAFTSVDLEASETMRPTHKFLDATTMTSTPLPELMQTCRRAYTEMAPLAHGTVVVRVRIGGSGGSGRRGTTGDARRIGIACHGVLRPERLSKLVLVVAMEHANWNAWIGFFTELAGRIGRSLDCLVVDWAPRDGGQKAVMASRVTWQQRQYEHKEDEFLRAVAALSGLKKVHLYGRTPVGWKERIEKDTQARVRLFRERWWADEWTL